MTTLELKLNLTDDLAQRAQSAGLITSETIESMLCEQLKKRAGESPRAMWARMPREELTLEIEQEIIEDMRGARAERRKQIMRSHCSVFEYLYRDASNFKAWGRILLLGTASPDDAQILRRGLDFAEYFVAEQVGIPVLYQELWAFSGGPNIDDHAYHEFFNLRPATKEEKATMEPWGKLSDLLKAFREVGKGWDCTLSPHCCV